MTTIQDLEDATQLIYNAGYFINSEGVFIQQNPKWLLSESNLETINVVREKSLHLFKPIKSTSCAKSSYYIKSLLEDASGLYISNGEAIIGLILAGFKFRINSPNIHFLLGWK